MRARPQNSQNSPELQNSVDFDNWIDSWTKIIRAFSQLVGEKPESSRVVFVQKSSPLIIDVAAVAGLVVLMGKAVDAVLAGVERYLTIRKLAEEIKKLRLENELEKSLEKEAEDFSEKSAREITAKLTAAMKPKPDGEVLNFTSLNIHKLFVFIHKGGRVDCPCLNGDDTKGLTDIFTEVRKLQNAVDQLRLPPPPEESERTEK